MNTWLEWGISIIEWFQNLGEGWLPVMNFFSFLGTENFIMIIMPALFWCYNTSLGFKLGIALLTSNCLNGILKLIFALPRPYWVNDKVRALASESSYGIPSGHSQNAVVLWGRLATALKHPVITLICIALIVLISFSRLYLGVHFPTDVLGGWLMGGLLLTLFMALDKPISQRLEKASFRCKLILAIILPLCLLSLGILVSTITAQREIPEEWIKAAHIATPQADPIDPQNPEGIISAAGSLLGLCVGYVLFLQWNGYKVAGSMKKRLARYIVGVCGVVIFFFGLRMIFPHDDSLVAISLRFLRYAFVGFWVSYLAPRVFVSLRLA